MSKLTEKQIIDLKILLETAFIHGQERCHHQNTRLTDFDTWFDYIGKKKLTDLIKQPCN